MTLQPSYYFNQTPVSPAVAINSPTNQALGVPAGQYGGQGMGMPAGASATPAAPGGMNIAGGANFAIDGLSQALQSYIAADAARGVGKPFTPRLVDVPVPQIAARSPVYG